MWGALQWLLLVNALLGFSSMVLKCLRGCGRWLLRCFELSRPDAKLSRDGRWNFSYVQALVADPRDVNSYVWGFRGVSVPRLPPGEEEERSSKGGGSGGELAAVAICLFLAAVGVYALAVSHAARWGLQTSFLLSRWALYLVLVAAAVAFGNAFGTRLFAACASGCAAPAPPRKAEPTLPSLGPADPAATADAAETGGVAPAALVELGSTTLRELRELRGARQPTAAASKPELSSDAATAPAAGGSKGAKSKGAIRMLSGGRSRPAAML